MSMFKKKIKSHSKIFTIVSLCERWRHWYKSSERGTSPLLPLFICGWWCRCLFLKQKMPLDKAQGCPLEKP